MASVTELFGRLRVPDTYRLVVVALVANKLVEVTMVPDAEVKPSGPDNDPPVSNK